MSTPALAALLAELIADSGLTKQEFAKDIGVTGPVLSHLLSGKPTVKLNAVGCLRIARRYRKVDPSKILRAAGKGEVADLIEELYGPAAVRQAQFVAGRRLSTFTERKIARLLALDPEMVQAIFELIDAIIDTTPQHDHAGGSRHHARAGR